MKICCSHGLLRAVMAMMDGTSLAVGLGSIPLDATDLRSVSVVEERMIELYLLDT